MCQAAILLCPLTVGFLPSEEDSVGQIELPQADQLLKKDRPFSATSSRPKNTLVAKGTATEDQAFLAEEGSERRAIVGATQLPDNPQEPLLLMPGGGIDFATRKSPDMATDRLLVEHRSLLLPAPPETLGSGPTFASEPRILA